MPKLATNHNENIGHDPSPAIPKRTASELNGNTVAARNEAKNKPSRPKDIQVEGSMGV